MTIIEFIPVDKNNYIKYINIWQQSDKTTYYMARGLYPHTSEQLSQEYDNLVNSNNIMLFVRDKDKIIGLIGLYNIQWQPRHAEYRIILGENRNKGIGTKSTKLMIKYAFEKLNLNKVWLGVNIENKGAIKCYEKSGFIHEGVLREEIYRNNRYYDALRMSILKNKVIINGNGNKGR